LLVPDAVLLENRSTWEVMKKLLLIILSAACFATITRADLPVQTVFTGKESAHTWRLAELNPDLPANWTGYQFLVLEFKASSSQRFDLGLETPQGRYAKRIGPFAGVWVRASIPLRFYRDPAGNGVDLAATFNQPHSSYWINIDNSRHGPLTNVTGLTVAMNYPVGVPTLEIRSITLATNDPGDAVLAGKPLVDEFGQYTHAEWPGKAHSLAELKQNWEAEAAALQTTAVTNRDTYGGFLNTQARATGFFRVEQIDGRWWFVDPDGHLFFSNGLNGVGGGPGTRAAGRRNLFAALPPANTSPGLHGRGPGVSFYTWNLQRRFGDDWWTKWADLTTRRLTAWGFNTMQNWGQTNPVEPRVPYALMMRGWQTGNSIMGLPDVYADDFARRVDEPARTASERSLDARLLHRQRTTVARPRKFAVRRAPERTGGRNATTAQNLFGRRRHTHPAQGICANGLSTLCGHHQHGGAQTRSESSESRHPFRRRTER
jgi:hypothetical protein